MRSQMQVAFSPATGVWFLVGASPDLRRQILDTPELSPSPEQPGHSPIAGVFLLSADVDSVMGLLHLREFQSFSIFATPAAQRILREQNNIFRVLERSRPPVQWETLSSGQRIGHCLPAMPGVEPVFFYSIVTLGNSFPDYGREDLRGSAVPEDATVGLLVEQGGRKLFIAPCLPDNNSEWIDLAASSTVALLDGTFWSNEELLATGRSNKTARDMGHLPLSGPDGLLAKYPKDGRGRKILIHINNTNPILDESSEEHRAAIEAGFEIAYDGLNIQL